jgi:hypothetical protein
MRTSGTYVDNTNSKSLKKMQTPCADSNETEYDFKDDNLMANDGSIDLYAIQNRLYGNYKSTNIAQTMVKLEVSKLVVLIVLIYHCNLL